MLHQLIIAIRRQFNKLISIPIPELIEGQNALAKISSVLTHQGCKKPLVVTDAMLVKLGISERLTKQLDEASQDYAMFDEVTPDPTLELIANGIKQYQLNQCDSIIAIGGGSVIDCAKSIGACIAKNKDIKKLAGLFKIRTQLPTMIVIPTTAGTGSETTLVAVVTDPVKKQKFTVIDPAIVPKVALLDAEIQKGLPPKITAETGMDALTHAIESYISKHATAFTKEHSLQAIKAIFDYLPRAYHQGEDVEARTKMAKASFQAGLAFTRASIGYVHAIAHQLGGYYHVPHGLANSILLPHVLAFSFDKTYPQYAEFAELIGVSDKTDDEVTAAKKFLNAVNALLDELNIQKNVPELQQEDIQLLAKRAIKEANFDYPVPKVMSVAQCQEILTKLLK